MHSCTRAITPTTIGAHDFPGLFVRKDDMVLPLVLMFNEQALLLFAIRLHAIVIFILNQKKLGEAVLIEYSLQSMHPLPDIA